MDYDVFSGSVHVRDVGLAPADDEAVWTYAAAHDLVIVSKDSDFRQRSFLRGAPPTFRDSGGSQSFHMTCARGSGR